MIEAVLFDLDATLVDDGVNWRHSIQETLQIICGRHPGIEIEEVRKTFRACAGSVWEEIRGVESSPWGNMDDEQIVLLNLGLRDRETYPVEWSD